MAHSYYGIKFCICWNFLVIISCCGELVCKHFEDICCGIFKLVNAPLFHVVKCCKNQSVSFLSSAACFRSLDTWFKIFWNWFSHPFIGLPKSLVLYGFFFNICFTYPLSSILQMWSDQLYFLSSVFSFR